MTRLPNRSAGAVLNAGTQATRTTRAPTIRLRLRVTPPGRESLDDTADEAARVIVAGRRSDGICSPAHSHRRSRRR